MQSSPVQIEDYVLKSLRFALVSPLKDLIDPEAKYDEPRIEVNVETQTRDDDPLLWRSQLTIRTTDEQEGTFPYTFEIIYVGFFRVAKEFPANLVEQMMRANAPALLFSAAREALMFLTGRGRLPAIMLPAVTFIDPPPAPSKKPAVARKTAKKK